MQTAQMYAATSCVQLLRLPYRAQRRHIRAGKGLLMASHKCICCKLTANSYKLSGQVLFARQIQSFAGAPPLNGFFSP